MASRKQLADDDLGVAEVVRARELTVVSRIQRIPSDDRVRRLAMSWDKLKCGPLVVAFLTDGRDKGVYHICDGGTRWRAKTSTVVLPELRDPEYRFFCFIKEMTEVDAARLFQALNRDSMKPSAADNHKVDVVAGDLRALTIEAAVTRHGLVVGNGTSYGDDQTPGVVAAVRAMERIADDGFGRWKSWPQVEEHLYWVLAITRRCYTDSRAHHADLIQAVAWLGALNAQLHADVKQQDALEMTIRALGLNEWLLRAQQTKANEQAATSGGSRQRSVYLARALVAAANRGKRGQRLVAP